MVMGSNNLTVTDTFTNFDASSRTLVGGFYHLGQSAGFLAAVFRFHGADIVHNAAQHYALR